jgi:outer membrane protein OmpA-like peptidoglycan-associated protein
MNRVFVYAPAIAGVLLTGSAIAQEAEASGSFSVTESSASADTTPSKNGWIREYAPEAGLVELGGFFGMWWVSADHSLREPGSPAGEIKQPAPDFGLRAAYFPLSFLGAEGEGAIGPGANAGGKPSTLWGLRAHAIGQLPGLRLTPFALLGVGRMGVSSEKLGDDSDPAVHVGIGAKLAVSSLLGVRLDLRDNMTGKNPATRSSRGEVAHHPELLAGVTLTLGRSEKQRPPAAPVDRDGDGFNDPDDKCPDERGIAPDGCPDLDLDKDGILLPDDKCPGEKGAAPDGCPVRDRDGDGFLDPEDECPDEKGIAPNGCPDQDPDGDGILGAADQCPNEPETKNGFQDDDGCPDELPEAVKKFTGVIQGIEFDVDKATIRPASFGTLDEAANVLEQYAGLRLEISGHTDTDGKHERNVDLSRRRAEAVKEYFVKKGIAGDRIETRGAGPDEPIADNKTRAGKQKNRRIEFKILE